MKVDLNWNSQNQIISLDITENGLPHTESEIKELVKSKVIESNASASKEKKINAAIINILSEYLNSTFHIQSKDGYNNYSIEIPVETIDEDMIDTHLDPQYPISILLVEDHFLNQMTTKKLLTGWNKNVSVDIAENGLIAVDKQASNHYDVILMDIQMPIMNGIEATARIKESNPSLPIIALTANASKTEEDQCYDVGMQAYISKPFKPEVLFSKITQALQRNPVAG